MISEIVSSRLDMTGKINENDVFLNLDGYLYQYMLNKYGIAQVACRYCESWLVSLKEYSERDSRIALFLKFVGLHGNDSLPFTIFNFYVDLIKATNIEVHALYTKDIS